MVTGISGAGKSSALKALEDMGFETVDNVPLWLLGRLVQGKPARGKVRRALAVGIDIRTRDFDAKVLLATWRTLASRPGTKLSLVFMDAGDEVLQRRYAETRHRHPLAENRPLLEGIRHERKLLQAVRARADMVVDTSGIGPGQLKHVLEGRFGAGPNAGMAVFVMSFGFSKGLPREADLVFDVRFLRNPHYDPKLKPLVGLDRKVADYISRDRHFAPFFRNLVRLIGPLLPRYAAEGKSYLTIALGCTGGRHRSVFVAERLARWLAENKIPAELRHRELETSGSTAHNVRSAPRPGKARARRQGGRRT
ncbi:MAG: RNase adapter RapZ [Alphaproteobacteria bacterium]|nr:RNase adapter RapZ [Alphaproteobacteria bacterium]